MNYKEHACCWCHEETYEVVVKGPDLLLDNPGNFQFVRCVKCGLFRQNPYLDWESLKEYYPDDYSSYQPQAGDLSLRAQRWDKRYGLWKRVRLVHKYKPNGNWVDVGAGTGRILEEASLWQKWDLMGIEPVEHAAEYIKLRLGIDVFSDRLEHMEGFSNHFDIVTMWDVLEHLENPIIGLKKVHEILKPGGIFVFSIPNMESWDRKVFNTCWIGYDLPRHMHLYPKSVLLDMLNQTGFRILKKKCIAGSHGALMLNLVFWNRRKKSYLLSKLIDKGPDWKIPRVITFIPLWILDQLNLASNITYVVQKV